MLAIGQLISNSQFLPLYLSYIIKPRIFLDQLTVCQVPVEFSMQWLPFEFFYLLVFSAGLKVIPDILGSSFLCHIFLFHSIRFFVESILFSRRHIFALI